MATPLTSSRGLRAAALCAAIALVALPLAAATAQADDAVTFSPPLLVDVDDSHTVNEPSIRVAADGAIYVTGPQGLGGARVTGQVPGPVDQLGAGGDLLWRSDDGGGTFSYLGSYDGSLGGGDADITSAPDGTLYASGLTLACVTVAKSTDRGATFAANPAGCSSYGGLDDRQWNDVDGNDAVWTGFGTLQSGLVLLKSAATSPTVVNGVGTEIDSAADYQWPGVVDVDQGTGTAYMAWNTVGAPNDCDTGCSGNPRSASTTKPDVIRINGVKRDGTIVSAAPINVASRAFDTFDSFVALDTGKDGALYVSWSERHPGATAAVSETWVMLARSSDHGAAWSAPTRVGASVPTGVFPWVTAGDAGRVAVTYLGTPSTGFAPESTVDKAAPWYVYSSFSTDGGTTFTDYQTTPTPVHRGVICTSGTGCATGARDLGDFLETDLDAHGCLVTAYTDNSRDVVTATGVRSVDQSSLAAFVRQQSGPGLLTSTPCLAFAPNPDVPETALPVLLPALVAGGLGLYLVRRRRIA